MLRISGFRPPPGCSTFTSSAGSIRLACGGSCSEGDCAGAAVASVAHNPNTTVPVSQAQMRSCVLNHFVFESRDTLPSLLFQIGRLAHQQDERQASYTVNALPITYQDGIHQQARFPFTKKQ